MSKQATDKQTTDSPETVQFVHPTTGSLVTASRELADKILNQATPVAHTPKPKPKPKPTGHNPEGGAGA